MRGERLERTEDTETHRARECATAQQTKASQRPERYEADEIDFRLAKHLWEYPAIGRHAPRLAFAYRFLLGDA